MQIKDQMSLCINDITSPWARWYWNIFVIPIHQISVQCTPRHSLSDNAWRKVSRSVRHPWSKRGCLARLVRRPSASASLAHWPRDPCFQNKLLRNIATTAHCSSLVHRVSTNSSKHSFQFTWLVRRKPINSNNEILHVQGTHERSAIKLSKLATMYERQLYSAFRNMLSNHDSGPMCSRITCSLNLNITVLPAGWEDAQPISERSILELYWVGWLEFGDHVYVYLEEVHKKSGCPLSPSHL